MTSLRSRIAVGSALLCALSFAALPGCDNGSNTQAPPSVELKNSESKYGDQIAKDKAARDELAKSKGKTK